LYFYQYQDSRDNTKNLIEAYYNQYPFIPDLYYGPPNSSWKLLVFYLNSEPEKQLNIDNFRDYQPNNIQNILRIKYKQCSGGSVVEANSLLLPDISDRCGTQGDAQNIGFEFKELEDNHFIIQTASSSQESNLNSNNFLSVAFYSTYSSSVGPIPYFQLVAVDRTKYYFGNSPTHQPPQLSGEITLNFDKQNSRLNLNWPKATDPDTLDSLLTYEIQYATSTGWESLIGNATGTSRIVAPGDNFSISVRAKDDFNNYSEPALSAQWSYPETTFYITQTATSTWSDSFGKRDGNGNAGVSLQSITTTTDFQFNKVVLKIRHIYNVSPGGDSANLKLSVYPDKNNYPDFDVQSSSTIISNVFGLNGDQDLTFHFDNSVLINKGSKYWLGLEVDNYDYNQGGRNQWQNAISISNPYTGGEAGKTTIKNSVYSNNVYLNSSADWYMKIGLE